MSTDNALLYPDIDVAISRRGVGYPAAQVTNECLRTFPATGVPA
ncbi:MAG: hypothetical protein ABIO61_06525 [Thermomonas sp.]